MQGNKPHQSPRNSDLGSAAYLDKEQIILSTSLADVATSGDYDDLTNTPAFGTAAFADVEDFAAAGGGEVSITYPDVFALRAALDADELADGTRVMLHGLEFEVDSSLDDSPASWFYNTTGATNHGLRAISPIPLNLFYYSAFHSQQDNKMYQHVSADGLNWNVMNDYPIPRGAGNSTVGSRDQMPAWLPERGEWVITYTAGEDASTDTGAWLVSPSMDVWHLYTFDIGQSGGIRGTILPGGTDVCEFVWGGKILKLGAKYYFVFTAEYGPSYDAVFPGKTHKHFQPHIAEIIDIETLETANPVRLDFPLPGVGILDPENSKLPPDIIHHQDDGLYYACTKDDYAKRILIYSTSDLFGTWTLRKVIDQDGGAPDTYDSMEGPLWQVVRYRRSLDGELLIKHRIMLSDNRDENDDLVERCVYTESDDGPAGTYGDISELNFSIPTRNGGVINLPMQDDPRAMLGFMNGVTIFGGHGKDRMRIVDNLNNTTKLYPRQDCVYTFAGGDAKTITIEKTEATRFWISNLDFSGGSLTISASSGVAVADEIPAGQNDTIEFRWDPTRGAGEGRYVRIGTKNDGSVGSLPFEINGTNTRLLDGELNPQWIVNSNGRFAPFADGQLIGTNDRRIRGVALQARAVDGTAGTEHRELFLTQAGGVKIGTIGEDSNNLGQDVGHNRTYPAKTETSGTVVWNRNEGMSLRFGSTLTGALTIDVSDMKVGDKVTIYINSPDSRSVSFTAPSGTGSILWENGAALSTNSMSTFIRLERVGTSNVIGFWSRHS